MVFRLLVVVFSKAARDRTNHSHLYKGLLWLKLNNRRYNTILVWLWAAINKYVEIFCNVTHCHWIGSYYWVSLVGSEINRLHTNARQTNKCPSKWRQRFTTKSCSEILRLRKLTFQASSLHSKHILFFLSFFLVLRKITIQHITKVIKLRWKI